MLGTYVLYFLLLFLYLVLGLGSGLSSNFYLVLGKYFAVKALIIYLVVIVGSTVAAAIRGVAWYANIRFHLRVWGSLLLLCAVYSVYLAILADVKQLNPANYDTLLWNLDRHLTLGTQPNLVLHNFFKKWPLLASVADRSYLLFFPLNFWVMVVVLLEPWGSSVTQRTIHAVGISWLLGALLHIAVPSDGPCYSLKLAVSGYGVIEQDLLSPLPDSESASMESTPTEAVHRQMYPVASRVQSKAFENRRMFLETGREPDPFFGVAAFPSLHIALPLLFWLMLRKRMKGRGRVLVSALLMYAVVTIIAAIGLQWHYLIDIYGGVFVAWASYRLVGLDKVADETN